MELINTRGLVLRTVKYGETSVICTIYTEALGLRSYIVNGVRTAKSKGKSSQLQVMQFLDLVVYQKGHGDLQRIKEIQSAYVYQALPFDIKRSSIGLFITEVLAKVLREEESNPQLFDFIYTTYTALDTLKEGYANIHLYFLVQLSAFLGFMPGGDYSAHESFFDMQEGIFVAREPLSIGYLSGADSELLSRLRDCSLEELPNITINSQQRRTFIDLILRYYHYHLEGIGEIHAHKVFRDIL